MAQKAKQEAELKEKLDRMNDEELVADRLHKIEQARLETEMRCV